MVSNAQPSESIATKRSYASSPIAARYLIRSRGIPTTGIEVSSIPSSMAIIHVNCSCDPKEVQKVFIPASFITRRCRLHLSGVRSRVSSRMKQPKPVGSAAFTTEVIKKATPTAARNFLNPMPPFGG